MADWNSEQYLKFKAQRTQPAIDLAARLEGSPREIIDLGCGPGNSTRVLKNRFPNARIIGADASENMLEKARLDNPDLEFLLLDLNGDLSASNGKFDVVFSNACFQWVENHRELLPRVFGLLKPNGALAAQIPMNFDEPIHKIITSISESEKWRGKFPEKRIFHTLTQPEYFDILSELTDNFELWQTTYFHRMPSLESIIEWYRSTGLRTYLAALSEADGEEFIADVSEELKLEYPKQQNGEIIFKFPRFFFIAKKTR
ncbi:MAG: methyltransferase domain-containing protein [Oscillospiraceae bacterium]|nr:methyltransferase domain-containing protein [Oscillospiraceae bacterium]